MAEPIATIVKRRALVKSLTGDSVLVLLEHNSDGERILCSIGREAWGKREIDVGQEVIVSWDGSLEDPPIKVELVQPQVPVLVKMAREVLGIQPADKVVLIVGANASGPQAIIREFLSGREFSHEEKRAVEHIALKSVGWGECMLLPRLVSSLLSLGIEHANIGYKMCETTPERFNPSDYSDSHIIFIGSTKSNAILTHHYWSRLSLSSRYEFQRYALVVEGKRSFATDEHVPDDAFQKPENVKIQDHFLLARTDNPYSTARYKCLLICGTGTMGTGFGGLVAVGQSSIRYLHEKFKGGNFEIVGGVTMNGMFNPKDDPVRCHFDGSDSCDDLLLAAAMSSALICDPEQPRYDELFEQLPRDPFWANRLP